MQNLLAPLKHGANVLDPFSGTGSTVCAAVKLGRRAIGFDLSDTYTQIAEKRLIETPVTFDSF